MEKKQHDDLLAIGFMLFSLFFGAGNLIFPPWLGKLAGVKTFEAMLGFTITAVILPVLGVIAVAKTEGITALSARVSKRFSIIYPVLILFAIGPGLAIPRAGSVPFEMAIAPYVPETFSLSVARLIYTAIFFGWSYWICTHPGVIIDHMGKILTPILILLIVALFAGSFFFPSHTYPQPQEIYAQKPAFVQGFLEGYLTMDALASLVFGLVIFNMIYKRSGGTDSAKKDMKRVFISTSKAALIAGSVLLLISAMLAHLGAISEKVFVDAKNGAQILQLMTDHIFGFTGAFILAAIFTLACLTTCVGLIVSISDYFYERFPKVPYKVFVGIWTFISFVFANFGLDVILGYSVPILTVLYPASIVLIILPFLEPLVQSDKLVYRTTVGIAGVISLVMLLESLGIRGAFFTPFHKLPFYPTGLGWVLPTIIGFALTLPAAMLKRKKKLTRACN
ncbi:MAG: branched-chain amino acid transport system II carrier protein [Treponema phagedenis]|uniref:branched-chain amino acid transport system II carrier protein n=1 Tax=Treponema phagedenis TaxID=162 RepID=UPI003133F536